MTHQKPIVSLLLAGLLTLSLTACGKDDSQPSPDAGASVPAGTAVQVETVTSDTISSENKVSGKVTSDLDASVFVATSAKCTAVYVEVGDTVRAGQALCTLDLASTLSSYEAANIGYTSAVQSYQDQAALFDKQIALYEKNVNDLKALQEIGAASQSEIDAAELTLMSAQVTRDSTLSQLEAGIQSAKASVEQLATALENVDARGNVIAPISGVLLSLSAEKDGFVSSAMPVAVIDGVDGQDCRHRLRGAGAQALHRRQRGCDRQLRRCLLHRHHPRRGQDRQCPDQAVYCHGHHPLRGGWSALRYVCRRDVPYRHLC